MRKGYLLGGETIRKRDGEKVNRQAFCDANGSPDVLVFPWASANFDQTYQRQKMVYDYLRYLGANSVTMVDYSCSYQEIKEKMSQSDLVYLTGGSASILVERFRCVGVNTLLNEFNGVVVGRSAGALALCSKCLVTVRSTKQAKVVDGLGLVDLMLKVHYTRKKDVLLCGLSLGRQIFAVPSGSALVFDSVDGSLSCVGLVFVFENGERREFCSYG
ncbi:MAG: Type 1 glutamine amidotransferase-like domain-containing protein [Candidatus Bathyarchaeota archaeon]|nr:Type 1 glutamine amidotransferase-like domain-containing protein [Candidatus Termiticorpusculum sp.]